MWGIPERCCRFWDWRVLIHVRQKRGQRSEGAMPIPQTKVLPGSTILAEGGLTLKAPGLGEAAHVL